MRSLALALLLSACCSHATPAPATPATIPAPVDECRAVTDAAMPQALACREAGGTLDSLLILAVGADGTVGDIEIKAAAPESPIAACVRGVAQALVFPASCAGQRQWPVRIE
jgi:hypothetical protein